MTKKILTNAQIKEVQGGNIYYGGHPSEIKNPQKGDRFCVPAYYLPGKDIWYTWNGDEWVKD